MLLAILQRDDQIWPVHLCEIKGVYQRLYQKPGTRSILQQPCRAGPQRQEPIEVQVSKKDARHRLPRACAKRFGITDLH